MGTNVAGATRFSKVQLTGDALYDSNGNQILAAQGTAIAAVSVAGSIAGGTGAASGGWARATLRDRAIALLSNTATKLNLVIAALKTAGIIDT